MQKTTGKTLILLLLAGLLVAACQPALNPGEPATPTPAVETTRPSLPSPFPTPLPTLAPTATPQFLVPLVQLKGLQIRFAHPWIGEVSHQLDLLVDRFNQSNEWGIHVIVQRPGSSMALAQQVEEQADSATPNIIIAPSEHLLYWHENGDRVVLLNELISDLAWGLSEQQRADFPLVFWLQDQSDGNQLGIPVQRSPRVIFYNLSWGSELGFSRPPVTLEDLKTHACAAAQANNTDQVRTNDGTGGWLIDTDGLTAYSWMKATGLANPLQGDPARLVFEQPETLAAFEYLRGLVDEGCAWFGRSPATYEYFANRDTLFYTTSLLDLPLVTSTMARMNSDDVWTVLPFPGSDRPTVIVSGVSYSLLRSDPQRELAAWLFLRWMITTDTQLALLEAGGGFPVSASSASLANAYRQRYPQWGPALQWIPIAQAAPISGDWRVARFILEDAVWQSLQSYVTAEQIPSILGQLDDTIREVIQVTTGRNE